MQHALTFHPSDSPETESNPSFNVLIAYEDFESGKHAKQTYDYLVEHLGRECQLTNQMWKFDVLSISKLREIAVRDAVLADIIIISCRGHELPDPVAKWIESFLMEGTGALALVALFEQSEASAAISSAVKEYLADVAKRGHMEFFAQPDEFPQNRRKPSSRMSTLNDGPDTTLSGIAGIVQRDLSTPRWGLNE